MNEAFSVMIVLPSFTVKFSPGTIWPSIIRYLNGTAKGGIVFAIANECGLPVKYVGVGEGIDDLIPFDAKTYVEALFKK